VKEFRAMTRCSYNSLYADNTRLSFYFAQSVPAATASSR